MRAGGSKRRRVLHALRTAGDPRVYLHGLRLLHFANYTHVSQRRQLREGKSVRLAPNVSFANGERITIGDRVRIGARCHIWAGNTTGRIMVGDDALFGPEVFVTASNYRLEAGAPVAQQGTAEADVVIGAGCWLGARCMILAGVELGAGCVVAAGAVVTHSAPPDSILAGIPARVVGQRGRPVNG